jgi:hypothetical protein
MMAYIVVRKHIAGPKESATIENVYLTREDAQQRVIELAKNSTYCNIRLHVVAKQIKGKTDVS